MCGFLGGGDFGVIIGCDLRWFSRRGIRIGGVLCGGVCGGRSMVGVVVVLCLVAVCGDGVLCGGGGCLRQLYVTKYLVICDQVLTVT